VKNGKRKELTNRRKEIEQWKKYKTGGKKE
jgi:hypothetical protein